METKLTCILVDDEMNGREVFRNLLGNFFPEVDIVGEAENVDQAYELILKTKPQLVFLDIEMPRSSGFNLLRKFDKIFFEVIFVTGYDQYAITAFKFNALDYLLKPVEVSDLKDAIERTKKRIIEKSATAPLVINLLNAIEDKDGDRRVAVHNGEKVELIETKNIRYIQADGSYSKIKTSENQSYITSKFLKDFEEYFGEKNDFVRIHKSCLINVMHIKNYSKGEPCFIEMNDGVIFEVARRKKQEVLEKLKK